MANYAIYFSPTGTTRFCVRSICRELEGDYTEIDLTPASSRKKTYIFRPDDFVVIGFPVYGGRLPGLPEPVLSCIQGHGTQACAIVTYGNRAYEDALLELADLITAAGLSVIAGGAFIGQHTFSHRIASNRPDELDLTALKTFSGILKEKREDGSIAPPALPGNRPYRVWTPMPLAPQPNKNCIECGTCADVCPVEAISREVPYIATDPMLCIDCYACVNACPTGGRSIDAPPFRQKIADLTAALETIRREPEWFV